MSAVVVVDRVCVPRVGQCGLRIDVRQQVVAGRVVFAQLVPGVERASDTVPGVVGALGHDVEPHGGQGGEVLLDVAHQVGVGPEIILLCMAIGGLDPMGQTLILQAVDAQQVDGVAEFMGQYGLIGVAGLVYALGDAFDIGGGDGCDRVADHAPIAFDRPIHDMGTASVLGYIIDVPMQSVDAVTDHTGQGSSDAVSRRVD